MLQLVYSYIYNNCSLIVVTLYRDGDFHMLAARGFMFAYSELETATEFSAGLCLLPQKWLVASKNWAGTAYQ